MSLFRYRMAFRLTNGGRVVVTVRTTSGRQAQTATIRYADLAFGNRWDGGFPVIVYRTRIP